MANLSIRDVVAQAWFPVLAIGLVFLLVQIGLCFVFCFRLRREERAIRRLCRERERSGAGRPEAGRSAAKFSWTAWVNTSFPMDAKHNFTREDALQELDT